MKKLILIALFLCLTLSTAFAQPAATVIGGKEHDFGKSRQRQRLKHTFVIQNTGTDTLIIKSVKGG